MSPLAKYRVKRLLHRFGISPRGLAPARRDLAAAAAHLARRGLRPGTIIDVGVADGTFELYDAFPDAGLLLVEPLAEFAPALAAIAARRPARCIAAAAAAAPGSVVLHVGADLHAASVLPSGAGARPRREVPAVRLDAIAADAPPPFLIKADTQGNELAVIEGATGILPATAALILEASLFAFRPGQPLLAEVVARLRGLGFVPYDLVGGYLRPLDGALAQVDVIFVPEASPLRASQAFGAPALRGGAVLRARRALGL